MSTQLSATVNKLIELIHDISIRRDVTQLLAQPESFFPDSEQELERIHMAVVKLSMSGNKGFKSAERLYKVDYRDLLMCAEFGDIEAHINWANSILSKIDG